MKLQRRSFLGLGAAALINSRRPWHANAAPGSQISGGRARQVLVVLEQGGLSHVDTFDPKPETAVDHRSPFRPIDTNVPGIQFTELLTRTAAHADKLAVVRSMTHNISGHPEGTAYLLQGSKPGAAIEMPDLGTAVAHVLGTDRPYLPAYTMIPGNGEQSYNTRYGFLSPGLKVFKTGGRDLSDPAWRVNDLRLLDGVAEGRFRDRRDLLSNLDVGILGTGGASELAMENFVDRAFSMLDDPRTRSAFDLAQEPATLRANYGPGHRGSATFWRGD